MKEEWGDIPGYEDQYEVSSTGIVRSKPRLKWGGRGWYNSNGRVLKSHIRNSGYSHVILCKDSKTRCYFIHQLIAMAFWGHTPDGTSGMVVDHIDNNPSNNNIENLQVISHRENCYKDKDAPGVYWHNKNQKWCAVFTFRYEKKYIGSFDTKAEAKEAYINMVESL